MNFHQSFEKGQNSHSRHWSENNLKPPKHRIKRKSEGQQWMITRGSYVHEPMVKFLGVPPTIFFFLQISQNIDGFRQKNSQDF